MRDNSKRFAFLVTVGLNLGCTGLSASTLTVRDWQTPGDGALTYDSSTNLEWLDLTQTLGDSVISVDSQLDTGGTYEGFRYATYTEVDQLFIGFGIYTTGGGVSITKIDELAALIGQTYPANPLLTNGGGFKGFAGLNDPALYNRGMWLMNKWYYQDSCCGGATWWEVIYYDYDPSTTPSTFVLNGDDEIGSFLVRTAAVPVPAAAWLLGSGLIGLVGVARRRRAA